MEGVERERRERDKWRGGRGGGGDPRELEGGRGIEVKEN